MTVTSTAFLTQVQQLITLPANQSRFPTTTMLSFGNRKLKDSVVPVIHSLNEEFFVTKTTVDLVADQSQYSIPSRAMGRKLREVKLVNSSGNRAAFPQIAIERVQFYRASSTPTGFYMYGDKIEVVPTPTATGYSLELWWFLPPGDLVTVSSAAVVSSVAGDDVTVVSVPSTLTTGIDIDFVAGVQGNSYLAIDTEIQNIVGTTISFSSGAVPSGLAAGDYLTVAGTSPVLQIPDMAVPYLVTLTAMELCQAMSDYEGMDRLKETRDDQKANLMKTLEPRVEGEIIPMINDYGFIGGPRRGIWSAWGYL